MRKVKAFEILNRTDMEEYEAILNSPMCTVLEKEILVKKEKFYSDEGIMTHATELPHYVIHWEEKEL